MVGKREKEISRRDFVKRGAVTTATLAGFNVLPSPEARSAAPIRVGLIGCGSRGRGAAQDCMRSSKGVTVVALADLFEDRIEKTRAELAEKMGVTINRDMCFLGWDAYKQLLETDVDMVILATPPVFRPATLAASVKAKKHVFMEKPAAVDPPGIREVMKAGQQAKAAGLAIVAGTQRRHQKPYMETIRRIHDGAVGEILAARAYWCGGPIGFYERQPDWSEMEYQMRNWYHFLWLSGDHIVEQHVHNLDVINWAMGAHPVKAFGYGGRAWQKRGNIWDHHTVDFEFENGVHLTSMCRQIANCDNNVSEFVVGTRAFSNCAGWIGGRGTEWKFAGESPNPYVQEHADLIESIRRGEPLNEAQNVAESTMTAIMGRMAEYSGKVVTWDEAIQSDERLAPGKLEMGPVKLRPVAIPGGKEYAGEGWIPG